MRAIALLAAAGAATLLVAPALADPGQSRGRGHDKGWRDDGWRGDDRPGCPPGLAKKHNGCMPPGQARKYYWNRGARVPYGYSDWTRYSAIPRAYRARVPYDRRYRYVYRDDYVYVVDPQTRLVRDIIDLLTR